MNRKLMEETYRLLRARWPRACPRAGVVLGSGWSGVASCFEETDSLPYADLPGLGTTEVAGHAGRLSLMRSAGIELLVFQGRRHWYEGRGWTPVAIPLYLLKRAGARIVVLTNAAGGLRDADPPGTLMIIDDHINGMGVNPLTGPHDAFWGPRFPDQTRVYDPDLGQAFDRAAAAAKAPVTHGIYLAGAGPAYETPAEVRLARALGAHAVGMSTVPEAMLAHAAGLRVAGLSCITNPAAGLSSGPLSHEDVTAAAEAARPRLGALLTRFWEELRHDDRS